MDEFNHAFKKEREWAEKIRKGECGDGGNYREDPDPMFQHAAQIRQAYAQLADLLLAWSRSY